MAETEKRRRMAEGRSGYVTVSLAEGGGPDRRKGGGVAQAREAALPAGLDRHRLCLDLNPRICWYRNWKSVSPSQPWAARLKDCEDGIEAAQALIDWWNSHAGDWRRDQLTLKTRRAGLTFLDTVRVAKNLSRALQRLRAQLSVEPSGKLGARAVRHLEGRESPIEWLVGEHLARFSRGISQKAASRRANTIGRGSNIVAGRVSAYVAFVPDGLDEAWTMSAGSRQTIDRAIGKRQWKEDVKKIRIPPRVVNPTFADIPDHLVVTERPPMRRASFVGRVPMTMLLSPVQASAYLAERGVARAVVTLRNLRLRGGGPRYRKMGNSVFYTPELLDEWLAERLSPPVRSSAELPAAQ